MMPDLGDYALYVLSAYGVTLALVIGLCLWTLHRSRKVKAELEVVETRARASRD